MSLVELMRLQMRTARMLAEAQGVISIRMMGMAGLIPSDSAETTRMVAEKQTAFAQAGMAAVAAAMAGKSPAQVYGRALTPIGRATRANHARLNRR